ncbi:MAG: DUF5117 domain-containing protein, partial [bacterium]|nr:DUF5117 domain-containing protein [bacterium]
MKQLDGYFQLHWDESEGRLWLEVERFADEFLYLNSLAAGVGSNDIGLDRGQLGRSRVVRFERVGPKVLLVQPNYGYRATTENPAERRAVEDSFARSVIWGFEVAAEQEGRVLVDATGFCLRDAHDVSGRLKRTNQGAFKLDESRSAFYLENVKSFSRNTEMEVTLTFTGRAEGAWLRQVSPSPDSVTVRQRHSFIELPGPGYTPRAFDPRAGFFGPSYRDYAAPLGEPIEKRFIARHRLEKRKPIVYYLDRGVPEPVRSALLDGARWWSEAFEAAGFQNGYRVELMPEDADPLDVRYNVIQWVHRVTRGWSYGSTVVDPRTGEIMKGQVSLGSLRVRQDYRIAEALLAPYTGGEASPAMREMALARLRQLSAHEVGHTLGLAHNYIASTRGRASVMDYPHPLVRLGADGSIDLSNAYATGVGEWDKVAITYGYAELDEPGLAKILSDAEGRGITFLTDADARPQGSAHPEVHLWDNGADAVDELVRFLRVRARALERFSEKNIPPGAPLATLEEVLAPLYLSHRYQTEAAAKVLGGLSYTYAMRGDGQRPMTPVPPEVQRAALDTLLATVSPTALTLPENLLKTLPPRPFGYPRHRETFPRRTGVTFDPLGAAEAAANHTVGLILHTERAARLVEYHARDNSAPSLGEVLDTLIARTWKSTRAGGLEAEVQRTVENVVLYHLMVLASDRRASPRVRAEAGVKLEDLKTWLETQTA